MLFFNPYPKVVSKPHVGVLAVSTNERLCFLTWKMYLFLPHQIPTSPWSVSQNGFYSTSPQTHTSGVTDHRTELKKLLFSVKRKKKVFSIFLSLALSGKTMGQPNTMSNSSVQQNSNNKKKSSNYAKTLAEIKNSISQFERTEQGQNMGRPGSSASIGSAADFVNYMMSLGFDEVRTNTFFRLKNIDAH